MRILINSELSLKEAQILLEREWKKHKYLILSLEKQQRTLTQGKAIHLYCDMLAYDLTSKEFDIRKTLRVDFQIPWDKDSVKKLMWHPVQKSLFGTESTAQLATDQVSKVYDAIRKHIYNTTDETGGTQNQGIEINGDAANPIGKAILTDNIIIDTRGTPETRFGIKIQCVTTLKYHGNTFDNMLTSDISIKDVGEDISPSHHGVALYDFSVDGGATGIITLNSLPENATITKAWYEVITAFTSGGSATVGFGVAVNDATGLKAVTAFDDATYGVGYDDFTPDGAATNFTTKTTDTRDIRMTIATAALTAGKVKIWYEYSMSA